MSMSDYDPDGFSSTGAGQSAKIVGEEYLATMERLSCMAAGLLQMDIELDKAAAGTLFYVIAQIADMNLELGELLVTSGLVPPMAIAMANDKCDHLQFDVLFVVGDEKEEEK